MNTISQPDQSWSTLQKILFRFIFIFFGLYILIHNNGAYPFWNNIMALYPEKALHIFIPWVGKNILQLSYDIKIFTNGSGDTTYDYVIVFTIFTFAIFGTTIWSILDRKKRNYSTLFYWLTVAVRFYVGMMLISYGLDKVFKLQFPSPGLYRLTSTYGDSSPMGLAWTFLGFSVGYNLFMGLAEVAAVLLLFRRTVTLGAIISLMTTANVMAVNYFYDVPVKILSTELVMMTLFILVNDAERLFSFFFTDKPVSLPVMKAPEISTQWLRISKFIFKFSLIGFALVYPSIQNAAAMKKYGDGAPRPKLNGLYDVDLFVLGKDTLPPLTTDPIRWRQLSIAWNGYARVRLMNDSIWRLDMEVDTTLHNMSLKHFNAEAFYFKYSAPDLEHFELKGRTNSDSLYIRFKRRNIKDFRLLKRGFHWVNEYPFNR